MPKVEPLSRPTAAKTLAISSGASASVQLEAETRRVSIYALDAPARFCITAGQRAAVVADHYIALGERLDFAVEGNSWVNALGGAAGSLEITEMVQ